MRKYKRHASEIIKDIKLMYPHECIIIPIIIHCRVATPKSIEFRWKFEFNQYDTTLTSTYTFGSTYFPKKHIFTRKTRLPGVIISWEIMTGE